MMFRCHQTWEHSQAAPLDDEIVIPAPVGRPANLAYQQAPPLGAKLGRQLLQRQDAMSQTLDVGARVIIRGSVIE